MHLLYTPIERIPTILRAATFCGFSSKPSKHMDVFRELQGCFGVLGTKTAECGRAQYIIEDLALTLQDCNIFDTIRPIIVTLFLHSAIKLEPETITRRHHNEY